MKVGFNFLLWLMIKLTIRSKRHLISTCFKRYFSYRMGKSWENRFFLWSAFRFLCRNFFISIEKCILLYLQKLKSFEMEEKADNNFMLLDYCAILQVEQANYASFHHSFAFKRFSTASANWHNFVYCQVGF